jgi:hypothetical protein
MVAGVWREKPLAICFLPDGSLGNGQHTLTAISITGRAQTLLIARNVPKSTIAAMDRGAARTVTDVAKFTGDDISRNRAAIAKVVAFGVGTTARSYDETMEAYNAHKGVIDFVSGQGHTAKISSAAILAVCARAAYSEDRLRISEFLKVLKHGIGSQEDSAAIRLRDAAKNFQGGSVARAEIYCKTQSALRAFLDRKPLAKLYGTTNELFAIPGVSV